MTNPDQHPPTYGHHPQQPYSHPHGYNHPHGYGYGYPHGYGYAYPPPPPPAPRPWHHYVTWPVLALTAIAQVYTQTARVMDYQTVIVFAYTCVLASIAALIVTIRARHAWTIVFTALNLLAAIYLLVVGYNAMEQFEQILDDTIRDLDNLRY